MQQKLQGIEMALAQTHKSKGPETKCPNKTRIGIIFTDNQAAIQACASPRSSSGQYILHQISQLAAQVQGCEWNIQLQWTPGHGLYIAMNTLMHLPRTPLAPRPMLAEEPVLMASTRCALCHGAAVDCLIKHWQFAPVALIACFGMFSFLCLD